MQRERALKEFKSGEMTILVATDVASRGLDIPNVAAVVNYDTPKDIDAYVHRIGRTGRIGKSGKSISIISQSNSPILPALRDLLVETQQEIPAWLNGMMGRRY